MVEARRPQGVLGSYRALPFPLYLIPFLSSFHSGLLIGTRNLALWTGWARLDKTEWTGFWILEKEYRGGEKTA